MKKIIKIISAFLAAGSLFVSCDRIDLEGIGELNKIEIWYGPYTSDAAPLPEDSVLVDFVEKDLGISLKAVPLPSSKDEQTELLLNAAKTNSLPDIFMVNRDVLTELVRGNYVTRVDSLFLLMPERTLKMYDDVAKKAASFDGICYGLAQSGSIDRNEGILIRKDWLDKLGLQIPVTLEDYYNVMKAFTNEDPDGDGLNNTYGYGAFIDIRVVEDGLGCRFAPFFGAFGVEGTFNSTKANAGLNIYKPEYKKALECINNSSSDEINDPLVIMSKGQCYLRLGDRRNANRCYKKAIAVCDEKLSETKDTITLNIKGNCNLLLKNYIEAIECYNEVLDTDEKNSLALSFKSVALIRLDETDAAFDCLKKLSEIDSDNNDVKLFKVQYFNSIGKYEKSLKLLREVIESPYDYPQAYMLRADVFVELGKFDDAMIDINKSLELNSTNSYSLYVKAKILMHKYHFEDALMYLVKAISIDSDVDSYYFDKGSCHLNLCQYDDAFKSYAKAFRLNPHSGGIANRNIFLDFIHDLKKY